MKERVNLGLVGAGKAGTAHAQAFSQCENTRIVRIVSGSSKSAHGLAKTMPTDEYPEPAYGIDFEAILKNHEIDAVVIASPDKYHYPQAVAALEAGKHVLVEKPMCRTVSEAEEMIITARKAGRILMVGFVERFNHPFAAAKQKIDAGEIGRPVMILARRCHTKAVVRGRSWLNDEETGGVLSYAGTHNIDLICSLMGSKPKRVYCESGRLVLPREQNFTDSAVMTFLFENGGIAALYESFAYPDSLPANVDRSIEVLGDGGCLKIDMTEQPLRVYGSDGVPVQVDSVTWPFMGEKIGGAVLEQARHFLSCIRGRGPVLTPGEAGLDAIRIAAAAREAARTGRAQEILYQLFEEIQRQIAYTARSACLPVVRMKYDDASAYGAALLACAAAEETELAEIVAARVRRKTGIEPDPGRQEIYLEVYKRCRDMSKHLLGFYS